MNATIHVLLNFLFKFPVVFLNNRVQN